MVAPLSINGSSGFFVDKFVDKEDNFRLFNRGLNLGRSIVAEDDQRNIEKY